MWHLLGKFLLVLGILLGAWVYRKQAQARLTTLRALRSAVDSIERDLSLQLSPLGELLAQLAQEHPQIPFFAQCQGAYQSQERPLSDIWQEEAGHLPLQAEDKETIADLGKVLGQYDSSQQQSALVHLRAVLDRRIQEETTQFRTQSKLSQVLALSFSAFCLLLF